ncbi:MAG: sel1 repeat family protein [Labilithrix sp.]|nr:sel1 repeat family protein [Labilithrix sp.]
MRQGAALTSVLTALLLPACGGAGGDAVRPKDITGAGALGAPAVCTGEAKLARPLVVDLDAASRVSLEAAMKKGVVIVAYDCTTLRVLPNCKAPGDYEYASVTRKEQVVRMTNQDDLSVNLPLSGAKLGAEMKSGNSIDLALVLIGQRSTTIEKVDAGAMTSAACEGATHYLQSASLGAFSMATGSAGKVAAVTDLFSVGAAGSSSSSRSASSTDGSLEACRKSDPDAPAPPADCRSPISLELHPLAGTPRPAEERGSGKDPKEKEARPQQDPCPPGYVFAGGICTRVAETAHLCKPEDMPDCKAQCDKGSFESCYNYATNTSLDHAERTTYFKKACDGGVANGCGWYALFRWDGKNTKSQANKEPIDLARKGCSMGGAEACTQLGQFLWTYEEKGPFSDLPAAIRAFDRGCALGDPMACSWQSEFYLYGTGVPKDEKRAFELMDRACLGGEPHTCLTLAEHLVRAQREPERALELARVGCKSAVHACKIAMHVALDLGKDSEAFAMITSACERDAVWCEEVGDLYAAGKGTTKDSAKATSNWQKACDAMLAADKDQKPEACNKASGRTKPAPKRGAPAKKPGKK